MSEAIRVLHALAQVLSMMNLYSPGHPATKRSADNLWEALTALLAVEPNPIFLFLGTAPVYDGRALHELRDWMHSRRLAEAGVQRLEFDPSLTFEGLLLLLDRLMVRLTGGSVPADEPPIPGAAFGAVAVKGPEDEEEEQAHAAPADSAPAEFCVDLTDELEAMQFVANQAMAGRVARSEAEAVARILGGVLDEYSAPQAAYSADPERYLALHAVNTAMLAMAASTAAGVDDAGRHRIGVTALLHNIGMARIPAELGNLGSLTELERATVESHTIKGAELLLDSGNRGLELAATVAYEHHLRPDGSGYPLRRFRPATHWASRLVGSCAAFTALRAPRPFRPAWPAERALAHLDEGAGTLFDADAARLVSSVIRAG